MPKRHYIIYCDESAVKGSSYSNFYGGALIRARDQEAIEIFLRRKKDELNLFAELKWTKITEQYLDKYLEFVDAFFSLIAGGRIKIRIMFTHNRHKPTSLTQENIENQYFILYYQLIKHAFGIRHCNPDRLDRIYLTLLLDEVPHNRAKLEEFRGHLCRLSSTSEFRAARVTVSQGQIADVRSNDHAIMQGLDIILGSIQFRLNDKHKERPEGSLRRGRRTIAKEKVYVRINQRIREIYPNFNIGITTGTAGNQTNRWTHPYRHWNFVPSDHEIDRSQTKKRK